MKEASIFFLLEVCLLSMDFQNVLRRYCGAVDLHDMQVSWSGGLSGSTAGCLRDCEVPDCREVGTPSRAENLLFIAVTVAETWWFGESGQERDGLLVEFIRTVRRATYRKAALQNTYVPFQVCRIATSKTAFIFASDHDHPFSRSMGTW